MNIGLFILFSLFGNSENSIFFIDKDRVPLPISGQESLSGFLSHSHIVLLTLTDK